MTSPIAKPLKRLGDFLNEQQEPFILELYLLERDYSKGWHFNEDSSNNNISLEKSVSCGLNKRKRRPPLPICKVLTTLLNKLAFHSQSNILPRDYDQRKKHAIHIDEEGTSLSSHKDLQFSSSHIHQTCNLGNMNMSNIWQRYMKGSPKSRGKIPPHKFPNVNEHIGDMEHRKQSCGVCMPKKITEDSLSGTISNLKKGDCNNELQEFLPRPDVSQILKSRRVSHMTKKQLFNGIRDVAVTLSAKDDRKQVCRQFKGPLETRNLICRRTMEWGHYVGDGVNLTHLLTTDSTIEWREFEQHIKDIVIEISDAILECINSDMISEMIAR